MTDKKQEIRTRLSNPEFVLSKLNLLETAKKTRNGFSIPCLWHAENEPSCSVRQHPNDGTLSVKCFGCDQTEDVFGLIAQVYGLSMQSQFPEVIGIAADMAGVSLDGSKPPPRKPPPKFVSKPPEYPSKMELSHMWTNSVAPADDTDAATWFKSRGLSVERSASLCRVIPKDYTLPKWAIFKDDSSGRYDWIMSNHRLIFPLYNSEGKIKSFKARCLSDGKLKNVNPLGFSTSGLCFGCDNAHAMLSQGTPRDVSIFAEGEVDYLSAVQRLQNQDTAVYGLYNGGWSDEHSKKINSRRWYFLTDTDDPGDKYIKETAASVRKFHKRSA